MSAALMERTVNCDGFTSPFSHVSTSFQPTVIFGRASVWSWLPPCFGATHAHARYRDVPVSQAARTPPSRSRRPTRSGKVCCFLLYPAPWTPRVRRPPPSRFYEEWPKFEHRQVMYFSGGAPFWPSLLHCHLGFGVMCSIQRQPTPRHWSPRVGMFLAVVFPTVSRDGDAHRSISRFGEQISLLLLGGGRDSCVSCRGERCCVPYEVVSSHRKMEEQRLVYICV